MWVFHLKTEKDLAYVLGEDLDQLLYDHGGYDDLVITLFEDPKNPFSWILQGVTASEPDLTVIQSQIDPLKSTLEAERGIHYDCTLTKEKLPEKDWVAENRKQFPALEIAGFYIYGSHISDPQPQDYIPLQIDASTAFGTGNHATTHGCLSALQILKGEGYKPQNPLDIGTGTGILAMGIAKIFDISVLATDIDQDAVDKATYNASLNDLADHMSVIKADGVDDANIQSKAPYDLVVANILAGPLMDMAPDIKSVIHSGGYLILSGILDHQVDSIKKAYDDGTLVLSKETYIDEWVTLIFKNA